MHEREKESGRFFKCAGSREGGVKEQWMVSWSTVDQVLFLLSLAPTTTQPLHIPHTRRLYYPNATLPPPHYVTPPYSRLRLVPRTTTFLPPSPFYPFLHSLPSPFHPFLHSSPPPFYPFLQCGNVANVYVIGTQAGLAEVHRFVHDSCRV
mmetsp:Transcript_31389/g.82187  ORF Transcript_31389/g.82187 Transcript_31389/m.82187 type:complete len:150 (-) Transcript_31389:413-862(-)